MDASLITDWLGHEGGFVLRWWLLVTLAGAAAWPLLYRLMGALPDRGYTLARAAGLMLAGFVFWFLGSVGLLRNEPAGMVFAWLVVVALGAVALWRWDERPALRPWLGEHWPLVVLTETLFLALLFGWAMVRAHNPEMYSTEKPMEIMFINAIRASEVFPPQDAWLSGYAISYYYFGYVIIAMLADLSSVSSSIAFNITIALVLALTGIGALGVIYNLVRADALRRGAATRLQALGAGALGLCFLVLMGNLGTALVELPWRGYTPGLVNAAYFDFWDVEGRAGSSEVIGEDGRPQRVPADADGDGVANWDEPRLPLDRFEFTLGMGWRYSRVVHDRDLSGAPHPIQPITEFPNFSFVLADLHPHVLALPFAVLAIGLALALVLGRRGLARWEYPLYAIWVGGMAFVNSWDAIYLPLLVGAEALRRLMNNGNGVLHGRDWAGIARFAAILGGLTLVFYLPWLMSFTSQAGGVLPNVIYPTRWPQFVLQFGVFLVLLTGFLLAEMRRAERCFNWGAGLLAAGMLALTFALAMVALGLLAWESDMRGAVFGSTDPGASLGDLLADILARRLAGLPTQLWVFLLIALVVGRLFARPAAGATQAASPGALSPATGFALLLVGAGAVLTIAPDFVYLRDNFGVRINTVFKLYYQGWILFSIAAAFGVWSVLGKFTRTEVGSSRRTVALQGVYASALVLLFAAGMAYPVLATQARALVDTGRLAAQDRRAECLRAAGAAGETAVCEALPALTLDGAPTMVSADEYAAIQCLAALEREGGSGAVLAEAPGGAYEPHKSRFSGLTGIPTLIGWQNHQRQWRGTTYALVTDYRIENGQRRDRVSDVQDLYTTQDWARAWQIIDRYGIDYIVVGGAERTMIRQLAGDDTGRQREYELGLAKFEQILTPVCEYGGAAVYRVRPR
jgi:YYY domain-containing protein